jgi:hypothetical protein
MAEVGQKFGPKIKENCPQSFFDEQRWEDTTESALGIMGRIKNMYETLEEAGELPDDAKKTLEADFYNTASVLWSVLRTGERFKDNPVGLTEAINSGAITRENDFEDPFLGNEIYTIDASWLNTSAAWVGGGQSQIGLFFSGGGEYYMKPALSNMWWPKAKGPDALYAYAPDPENPKKAALFDVEVAGNPELEDEVSEILKSEEMDRAGISFKVINSPGEWIFINYSYRGETVNPEAWGGLSIGDHPNDPNARTLKMFVPDGLKEKDLKSHPYLTHGMVIHEGAHAIANLAPWIINDYKTFKHRMAIDRVVRWLRPYSDLKKFFDPRVKNYNPESSDTGNATENWDERYRQINMATVTNYAARTYAEYDLPALSRVVYSSGSLRLGVTTEHAFKAEYDMPVLRHVLNYLVEDESLNNLPTTFKVFWNKFREKIKEGGGKLTSFERLVFGEVQRNMELFDSDKRGEYVPQNNWQEFLVVYVLPMAMKEAYINDPEGFKMYLKKDIANPKANKALEHGIDSVFRKTAGQVGNPFGNLSDNELFAEFLAYNHVRKMDGTENEIPETVWNYIERMRSNLIKDLQSDGLAMEPRNLPVM